MDFDKILHLLGRLADEEVAYAVVGGIAFNLLGVERATRDLDLFVRPERADIEGLKRALSAVYDDPQIDEIDVDEMLSGACPSVAYGPPDTDFHIDILRGWEISPAMAIWRSKHSMSMALRSG